MRWPSAAAAGEFVRLVIIPSAGVAGMMLDRPLTPLTVGAYLAMMGLPATALLDVRRERRNGATPPVSGSSSTGPT